MNPDQIFYLLGELVINGLVRPNDFFVTANSPYSTIYHENRYTNLGFKWRH
jgi:hypothetical protein